LLNPHDVPLSSPIIHHRSVREVHHSGEGIKQQKVIKLKVEWGFKVAAFGV